MSKNLQGRCFHDVPSAETSGTDSGEILRGRAAETCGFKMGIDLFDARRDMDSKGGPEAILKRAVQRAERGDR